ncbi:TRAP transporter small permease subunit [Pseudogemmobacter sonorensis]|uniref:TRAP transporter small permease subunit n=1 Tax=Pseudogemmobacter sonorensis TaxID=2989681 RepID=UPI0036A37A63
MPQAALLFVRAVEAVNHRIGRMAMYLILVLAGILMWSVIAKGFFRPSLCTQEYAQFTMVGYFMLGGAWSLMLGANVRMDLLYARWSIRTRAAVDCVTVFAMITFFVFMLWGGIDSTLYALEVSERSRSACRPYMAPVKIVICTGAFLMLLQSIAFLIRDIATLRGVEIAPPRGADPQ